MLKKKAAELRKKTFETIYAAGGGHYGGSLSAIEILTVLYYKAMRICSAEPNWENRDRFVLCKGHAGPPLYVILADLGFIDSNRLSELDKNGGSLPKHVDRLKVEGIDYSSGPLGQGLSVACGMAAAAMMDKKDTVIYALMGDGELDEGQVWEAAMTAFHYKMDNLIAFVDRTAEKKYYTAIEEYNTKLEQEVEEKILVEVLNRFLDDLPEEKMKIFMRRYWYMSPIKEIADDFAMGESKVKMILSRSRNKLKQILEKEGIIL